MSGPSEVPDFVTMRRVEGPVATEWLLVGRWPGAFDVHEPIRGRSAPMRRDAVRAGASALYGALMSALASVGAGWDHVVSERLFLAEAGPRAVAALAGRRIALAAVEREGRARHAQTAVVQPPLSASGPLAVSVHVVVPNAPAIGQETGPASPEGIAWTTRLGAQDSVRIGGLLGEGPDAYAEAYDLFERADAALETAGLSFGEVVRTWIHLGAIERDYDALNRARRDFFAARGVAPPPASTGIGGAPLDGAHGMTLGLLAYRDRSGIARARMHTPTLNEAPVYGADFSRGMRVVDANKVALHVSGTASLDEQGRSLHAGDVEAQADRMLLNVEQLLAAQGADFSDVVSGLTYVKHAQDLSRLQARYAAAGFGDFPHLFVQADVCRPELLCETEVLAVRPRPDLEA